MLLNDGRQSNKFLGSWLFVDDDTDKMVESQDSGTEVRYSVSS
jgi:hypothetical protein